MGRNSHSTVQMRRQKCIIPNTLWNIYQAWLTETNASFRVLENQ